MTRGWSAPPTATAAHAPSPLAELTRLDAGALVRCGLRRRARAALSTAAMALLDTDSAWARSSRSSPRRARESAHHAGRARRAARPRPAARRCILSSFDEDALAVARDRGSRKCPRALIVEAVPRRLARADRASGVQRAPCRPTQARCANRRRSRAGWCRCAPIRSTSRRGPGSVFSWGAAAVFTDCPDVILSGIGHGTDGAGLACIGERAQ